MRRLTRFVAAGGLVAAVCVPRAALAEASARFIYMRGPGAEQCPGEEVVRAAVAARLGYNPFFAWAKETLFVEITRTGGAFVGRLALVDDKNMQRGSRTISVRVEDCAPVIDALALTVSLTIDPSSVMGPPASTAAAPSSAPSPLPSQSRPLAPWRIARRPS